MTIDLDELERKARAALAVGSKSWAEATADDVRAVDCADPGPEVLLALIERIRAAERKVSEFAHAMKILLGCWPAVALSSMDAAHEYIAGVLAEAPAEVDLMRVAIDELETAIESYQQADRDRLG